MANRNWFAAFPYQAGSWDKPRGVVAKIEHHKGELSPRVGFIVTNLRRPSWQVAKLYNGRRTAEPACRSQPASARPGLPRSSVWFLT
jgi:hypothetical protein